MWSNVVLSGGKTVHGGYRDLTALSKDDMLICGNCGRRNAPGTKLCTRCRFVLRGKVEEVYEPPPVAGVSAKRPKAPGLMYRMRHDRRTAAYAVAVMVVVIAISAAVYYEIHKDDPSPTAILFYRYVPPTETSSGMVQVYGNVHNWGGNGGTVFVDVEISDLVGHVSSWRLDLGKVPADKGVDVDEMLAWPHYCESTLDLTMTYDVGYKSDWWL